MPAQTFPVTILGAKYLCDVCGIGYMIPFGQKFDDEGEDMYPHKCNNCGTEADYDVSYPTTTYEGFD